MMPYDPPNEYTEIFNPILKKRKHCDSKVSATCLRSQLASGIGTCIFQDPSPSYFLYVSYLRCIDC